MKLTEKLLWFLLLTSILLRILFVNYFLFILFFGMIIAIFYSALSVPLLNQLPFSSVFKHEIYKKSYNLWLGCHLTGKMYGIACIGITLVMLTFPGASYTIIAAELLLVVNLIFVLFKSRSKPNDKVYRAIIQRDIYFLFITSIFLCFAYAPVHIRNKVFSEPSQTADSAHIIQVNN